LRERAGLLLYRRRIYRGGAMQFEVTAMRCVMGLMFMAFLGLSACSAWRNTYTLSPAVKESARRYSDVMDDFADQALLANVLRARDYAPMNFNDLSSITGALSVSGTLGLTLPFGPFVGAPAHTATSLGTYRYTGSPSLTGSSSPVINIGTLNTQGFMMTMIQPISTTYILSKWDSDPHELLLLLFIKSIRFPGETDDPMDTGHRRSYRNDPDSESEFNDFQHLIERMIASTAVRDGGKQVGNVDMKSLMILDPLGNPVPAGKILTATTPIPSQTLSVAAPGAPKLTGATGNAAGGVPTGTYYAKVTYVTNFGETLPSPEAAPLKLDSSQHITVSLNATAQGPVSAIGYNVYVSTDTQKETRQNQLPLPLGSIWTSPDTGLQAGGSPPGTGDGAYATSLPVYPATQHAVAGDYGIFQTINSLSDGQLHVGNSGCPDYVGSVPRLDPMDLCPSGSPAPFVQFYKEYPAQIVLCLDVPEEDGLFFGHHIYASSEQTQQAFAALPAAQQRFILARQNLTNVFTEVLDTESLSRAEVSQAETKHSADRAAATVELNAAVKDIGSLNAIIRSSQEKAARSDFQVSYMAKGPPSSSAPAAAPGSSQGGGNPGGGGGNNGGGSAAPGGMGQVTLALQPNRTSAIVPSVMCKGDQFVLHQESEEDFDQGSQRFTHIEWRSIAEVIQYLGAVARFQVRHLDTHGVVGWSGGGQEHRLFTYAKGSDGRIAVDYRDGTYSVPADYKNAHPGVFDHSLQTLALLNELISIAKISGSLPVPQPVTVLP
jgi:hypothetical protein